MFYRSTIRFRSTIKFLFEDNQITDLYNDCNSTFRTTFRSIYSESKDRYYFTELCNRSFAHWLCTSTSYQSYYRSYFPKYIFDEKSSKCFCCPLPFVMTYLRLPLQGYWPWFMCRWSFERGLHDPENNNINFLN